MLTYLRTTLSNLLSVNGELSMIRLLSLLCVVTACILAFIGISTTAHTLESVALLCGTFLASGLGAKVVQRQIEGTAANALTSNNDSVSEKALSRTSTASSNVGESGDNEDKK